MGVRKIAVSGAVAACLIGGGLTWYFVDKEDEPAEEVISIDEDSKEFKSDPNLNSNVEAYLNRWVEVNKQPIEKLMFTNTENITGAFVYGATLTDDDGKAKIDLGISTLTVDRKLVTIYDGFNDYVSKETTDLNGVAIVHYSADVVKYVEFRALDVPRENVDEAVLTADINNTPDGEPTEESIADAYLEMTSGEWAELASLTSKEYVNSNLAPPTFLLPSSNLTVSGDLIDNPNYIIVGELTNVGDKETMLKTLDGAVTLDFVVEEPVLNQPMWLHVLVHDGGVESVSQQVFEGADLTVVANGVKSFNESSK